MADQTNILVVDDDEDILSACRVLLKQRFDLVVTCRHSGRVLDNWMPSRNQDGRENYQLMRWSNS